MSTIIQRRRGTAAQHATFTGAPGEITVDTTNNRLVVHDGVTAGGHPFARLDEHALKLDKAGGTISGDLTVGGAFSAAGGLSLGGINGGPVGGFRNKIINGNFDFWAYASSQTIAGYASDNRWSNDNIGSTKAHSRQDFALGQTDVPGNPRHFSRTVVTSVAGAGNYVLKTHRIEDVRTLAGKKLTVTFWAKADAARNIAGEVVQVFGTGGSPSAANTGNGVTTCNLTTAWQKFTYTVDVPSVSGKTLGTNNDHFLALYIWMDAGTDFAARTNSLGQQSGTFDIAHVSVVEGDATGEADPFSPRHKGQEFELCKRYYEELMVVGDADGLYVGHAVLAGYGDFPVHYSEKRVAPTISITNVTHVRKGTSQYAIDGGISAIYARQYGCVLRAIVNSAPFGSTGPALALYSSGGGTIKVNSEL